MILWKFIIFNNLISRNLIKLGLSSGPLFPTFHLPCGELARCLVVLKSGLCSWLGMSSGSFEITKASFSLTIVSFAGKKTLFPLSPSFVKWWHTSLLFPLAWPNLDWLITIISKTKCNTTTRRKRVFGETTNSFEFEFLNDSFEIGSSSGIV